MFVYMSVFVYIRVYVCARVRVWACACVYECACICVQLSVYQRVYGGVCLHVSVWKR